MFPFPDFLFLLLYSVVYLFLFSFYSQVVLLYYNLTRYLMCFFFFQAEDGIRDYKVTGVQTCALPISALFNRFRSTCCSAWRSPSTGGTVPSSVSTTMSLRVRSKLMSSSVRWITSFKSTGACSAGPLRANVSRLRTIRPARSACS